MVLDAVSNFVRGNTDAAVDSTQTTVSVTDASIFPDPATDGEYNVVIWDVDQFPRPDEDPNVEVMRVTAIDTGTNDLTVVRGQEGTAGASHPSGSAVHLSPTAKMFSDIESTFGDFWNETNQELTADVNNGLTTTAALSGPYPSKVRAIDQNEVVANIDPADTTTPIKDAAAAINAGSGRGKIEFTGTVEVDPSGQLALNESLRHIDIIGIGSHEANILLYNGTTNPMFETSANTDWGHSTLDNLWIQGPSNSNSTPSAMRFEANHEALDVGDVTFDTWNPGTDAVVYASLGGPWQSHWEKVQFQRFQGVAIEANQQNPAWTIGTMAHYCQSQSDAIVNKSGARMRIGVLTLGNSVNRAIYHSKSVASYLRVDQINVETAANTGTHVVEFEGQQGHAQVDHVQLKDADVDYAVQLSGAVGDNEIGHITVDSSQSTVNNNLVELSSEPFSGNLYRGDSTEVDNTTATTKQLLYCIQDQTYADA